MSADKINRIAVMRNDGISYHTDVTGWSSETVCIRLMREAHEDKRVMYAVWFEAVNDKPFYVRQRFVRPEQ